MARLSMTTVAEIPFRWGLIQGITAGIDTERVVSELREMDFGRKTPSPNQPYLMSVHRLKLVSENAPPFEGFPETARLLTCLLRDELLNLVEEIAKVPIRNLPAEVNAWCLGPGDYAGLHTDRPPRVATVIVYLGSVGTTFDGGLLRLTGAHDSAQIELHPAPSESPVLIRSSSSWHEITRVTWGERWSLTLAFFEQGTEPTGHSRRG
jgi:2OG-Fe(II) oxygenase superfamily